MLQNNGDDYDSSNRGKSFLFGSWLRSNDAPENGAVYSQTDPEYEFAGGNQNVGLSTEQSPLLRSPIAYNGNTENGDGRLEYTIASNGSEQHPLLRNHRIQPITNPFAAVGSGTYLSVTPNIDAPGDPNLPVGSRLRRMSSDSYRSTMSGGNDIEKGYDSN
eukprot:2070196-Ditylum_brightwellii.AAC.1